MTEALISPIAVTPVREGVLAYLRTDVYVGRCLELYGEHSPGEVRLFHALLNKGDAVVEAGAHVGDHTLALAKIVGSEGKVVAFEPQEALAGLLLTNLAINNVSGWTYVAPIALGDEAAKDDVFCPDTNYLAPGNFGGISLNAVKHGKIVTLQSLDSFELPKLDFLKIDVEGMELALLRGAVNTIGMHRPVIYAENDRPEKSADLIRWLMEADYRLWWHLPRMIDRDNYKGKASIIYPNMVSINMLALPSKFHLSYFDIEERDGNRMWPVAQIDDRPDAEYDRRLKTGVIKDA